MTSAGGFIKAIESGSKHLVIRRFTFRYPEQKLKFVGDGYQFDPKRGVGIAGYRGRHILMHDKCTGCQLCAIACEGIAEAIGMVKVDESWKQNKKGIMPQIDYGKLMWKQTPGNKIQITYHRQLQLQKTIAEIGNTAY